MKRQITAVSGSSARYSTMSANSTLARLPMLTNLEMPTCSSMISLRMLLPMPPLWLTTETFPCGNQARGLAKVALRRACLFTTPMQLGPMSFMPPALAMPISSSCRSPPSVPVSRKPPAKMTPAFPPISTASRTEGMTCLAGMA